MSHRDECPTDYEARRQGERAYERGDGSWRNPYRDDYSGERCEDAERYWRRGYEAAEQRHEEQMAEERSAQRRAEERAQEERYYLQMQEEAYYREMEERAYAEQMQEEPQPDPISPAAHDSESK
jgi:hypothetical protein